MNWQVDYWLRWWGLSWLRRLREWCHHRGCGIHEKKYHRSIANLGVKRFTVFATESLVIDFRILCCCHVVSIFSGSSEDRIKLLVVFQRSLKDRISRNDEKIKKSDFPLHTKMRAKNRTFFFEIPRSLYTFRWKKRFEKEDPAWIQVKIIMVGMQTVA